MWGSVAKRLWLKASAQEDVATLRVLYPLFSSPACALAQVRAESEVLRSMLTTLPPELLLGNKAFAFERMVDTSLAFSKRVMSQLASAGSNRAAVMRPTLTRQQNLRKEYIYQPGFRAKTDACLTPICERHASRA